MGNICDKQEEKQLTSDERETWHWETWICYIPGINIAYGVIRAGVYYAKSSNTTTSNDIVPCESDHMKQVWKSIYASIAGVLTLFIPGLAATALARPFVCHFTTTLLGLLGEMVVGQLLQNLFITLGDIHVSDIEWEGKNWREKEKILYTEVFNKVPILGCIYSVIRSIVQLFKGESDEAQESFVNAVINAIGSFCGLWAAYGMHLLACGPRSTEFFRKLADKINWADDFGRLIFKISSEVSNSLQHVVLLVARGCGKCTGGLAVFALSKLKDKQKSYAVVATMGDRECLV